MKKSAEFDAMNDSFFDIKLGSELILNYPRDFKSNQTNFSEQSNFGRVGAVLGGIAGAAGMAMHKPKPGSLLDKHRDLSIAGAGLAGAAVGNYLGDKLVKNSPNGKIITVDPDKYYITEQHADLDGVYIDLVGNRCYDSNSEATYECKHLPNGNAVNINVMKGSSIIRTYPSKFRA